MIINKEKREFKIIDIVVPGDHNISAKEFEKIEKYENLRLQVLKLCNAKATVMPVIIDALEIISDILKALKKYRDFHWSKLPAECSITGNSVQP